MLKIIYRVIIDALFPLSKEEERLQLISPEEVLARLPKAPPYQGLTVPLKNTISLLAYKDPLVSRMIWSIKYKKDSHCVALGGRALHETLIRLPSSDQIIVIPMPSTSRRRRERGYNQCELLSDEIGRLDQKNRFIICKDMMERVHHTDRQALKNREDRLAGTKGLFAMNESAALKFPKDSILVVIDDVITTGSTIKEACDTLRKAGFSKVYGLSLAH